MKQWDCCGAACPVQTHPPLPPWLWDDGPCAARSRSLRLARQGDGGDGLWYSSKVLVFRAAGIPGDLKMTYKCWLWGGGHFRSD